MMIRVVSPNRRGEEAARQNVAASSEGLETTMTTTSTTYATRYGMAPRLTPARSIGRTVAQLVRAVATEYRIRRDTRALMTMSEHTLKDIGLSRPQVAHAVRFGRFE
jgi:uncharacterized protein YjiS (DUF1127 family)